LIKLNKYLFTGTFTLVLLISSIFAANVKEAELNSSKLLRAEQIQGIIKIDGELDEKIWDMANFSDAFQQREPGDGDAPTERTEIGCLYDKNNLYLGVKCYDSEPNKIIRTELRRDQRMDDDDYFEMILDTYHDNRSGFYFVFNSFGNKRDAKLSDEGRNYNPEWDGIWLCKTQTKENGWFAEVAIPWKTLRFVEGDEIYFGANFGRAIRRKNEKLNWSHIPREIGGFSIFKLSHAGHMGPFKGLRMGGNLEIQPFVIGGVQNDLQTEFQTDRLSDIGFDTKVNITSNLVADLTLNTDFAQVEADQERVNLTRFSLYFPEKRDFFLEGAEIFSTGSSGRRYGRSMGGSAPTIFYSRRIGIHSGRQIPLWGGAKITGKIGKTTIGVLNMQGRQTTYYDDDDEEDVVVPTTNYSAFRIKQDIFSRSSIGLVLTNNVEKNNVRNNQAFAVDSRLSFTPTLNLTTLISGTHTSDESNKNNKSVHANLSWRTDRYSASFTHTDIQPNFNAEMGYVRRTDIRSTSGSFSFSPRSKRFKSVRKFYYSVRGSYLTDQNNFLMDRDINFSYSIWFQSSARFSIHIGREYEFLTENWEVRDGIEINKGVYEGNELSTRLSTNPSKPLSAEFNLSVSEYYGGTRYRVGGELQWTGFNRFRFDTDYGINQVKLPHAEFKTYTVSNRFVYAFSTDMFVKAYIQYNSDRLRFDGRIKWNANILFRYIYRPGSDFYLVYNQEQLVGKNNNELTNRTIMAKVVYFWRK